MKDDLVHCSECEGLGFIKVEGERFPDTCKKCKGIGKIGWLENVFGRDEPEDPWYDEMKIVGKNRDEFEMRSAIRKDFKEKLLAALNKSKEKTK